MKYNPIIHRAIPVLVLGASVASAQTAGQRPSLLIQSFDETDRPLNRIGLSYHPGFNVSGSFKNVGAATGFTNPGPPTGGVDHIYDDGYNRVDSTGNAANVTSFWGYQNTSQVPGNNTIVMSSTAPTIGSATPNYDGDPQHGFEFTYNRELGHKDNWRWGVEVAFGYTDFTLRGSQPVAGAFTRTSDTYATPGINFNNLTPPYNGPFNAGTGNPVIGDTPTRSVTQVGGIGSQSFDANLYSLRLGPYVEVPLAKRLSFSLSGGLALMGVHSNFKFQESAAPSILGQPIYTGSGSHSDLLAGGYVAGNFSWAINRSVDLSIGAQYMNVGTYSHTENGKQANLNFRNSLFATIGVGYRF